MPLDVNVVIVVPYGMLVEDDMLAAPAGTISERPARLSAAPGAQHKSSVLRESKGPTPASLAGDAVLMIAGKSQTRGSRWTPRLQYHRYRARYRYVRTPAEVRAAPPRPAAAERLFL